MNVPGLVVRSGVLFTATCLAVLLTLTAGCGSQAVRPGATYTVKRGDTLYSIASRHGLDYREVARWNRIGSDYVIHPGQVIYLVPSNRQSAPAGVTTPVSAGNIDSNPQRATPASAAVQWSWPADNTSVTVTARPNSSVGLTMAGQLGQQIRAAAEGSVVYVGSGLAGYGQLVIIKHNDTYVSAYGHTQTVAVNEGERIRAGQPIATMGEGPGQLPMLYFEIRVNGQPTDPLRFLPSRSN